MESEKAKLAELVKDTPPLAPALGPNPEAQAIAAELAIAGEKLAYAVNRFLSGGGMPNPAQMLVDQQVNDLKRLALQCVICAKLGIDSLDIDREFSRLVLEQAAQFLEMAKQRRAAIMPPGANGVPVQ